MKKEKKRVDVLLFERNLVPSRERAQSLIISGNVLVNDIPVTKAGTFVSDNVTIRIRGAAHPYVSRGGVKLKAALERFSINVDGREALDVGASTGGFTEVLLERGAKRVVALDVGHNQLDWKIRQDPRVAVMEGINARLLKYEDLGQRFGVIVIDVSFISLEKILSALLVFADKETDWIGLIKPQFEVGRDKVGKGGIVRSDEDRQFAVEKTTSFADSVGLSRLGLIESPITGTDGNQEFLAHWKLRD